MLKDIKNTGIVALIIFVICCLVFAISFNFVDTKNTGIEQSSKTANDEQTLNETDFDAEIILKSDTNGTIADKWTQAINLSRTDGREVKVQLGQSWTATYNAETQITAFGTYADDGNNGYSNGGGLYVPPSTNIKLNLAGFAINRNQMKYNPKVGANVITVAGILSIVDTSYNSDAFKEAYDKYKDNKDSFINKINNIASGKICGGNLEGIGGGIYVGSTGTFNMYGGRIMDNSATSGGGIYFNGTFNFYDGLICGNEVNNTAGGLGGGLYCQGGQFNMYNGFIVNNTNQYYGGGIDIRGFGETRSYATITGGIIAHNYAQFGGGISINSLGTLDIRNADISYNLTWGNSAGVLIWTGTAEGKITNCTITHNKAYRTNNGANPGGAGVLANSKLEIYNSEITDNELWNGVDTTPGAGAGIRYENSREPLMLENVLITRNVAKSDINDGTNALGGGIYTVSNVHINGNVQIYDNLAHGVASDLYLMNSKKVVATGSLENEKGISKIGIKFAQGYSDTTFTTGYTANNSGVNPNKYFFNDDGAYMAIVRENELRFEKTIESGKYDFVYLENDLRKAYTETGFVHTKNDFDKSQLVNDKKVVLGKISPNTSVNEFIGNLNFASNMLKLYNNDNLIYNKGEQTQYSSLYDNGLELAVGTGWKLEVYASSGNKIEDIYLSVLGDITGDGKVNAADCNYLRKIVVNNEFSTLTAEQKLSALIVNRGRTPNNTDIQIIWEVVCGRVDINDFI